MRIRLIASFTASWLFNSHHVVTAMESSIRGKGKFGRATLASAPDHSILSSIPANPQPYREIQPDGSLTPQLYFKGDGRGNYEQDEEGYVVMKNEEGWYVYAEEVVDGMIEHADRGRRLGNRTLIPGKYRVGTTLDPASVPGSRLLHGDEVFFGSSLPMDAEQIVTETATDRSKQKLHNFQRKLSSLGNFRSLVILIRFKDHKDRDLPTRQQITNLYNHEGIHEDDAPTGSVRQVYLENSYGLLDSTAFVTDWITVSKTENYYANGEYGFERFVEAIKEAMDVFVEDVVLKGLSEEDKDEATAELMNMLDRDGDGTIDGLGILHSGYGAEYSGPDCYGQLNENRIWSHQAGNLHYDNPKVDIQIPSQYYVASSMRNKCKSDIVRVGIVAHEIGHQLGLPDLYDKTWEGNGLGNYDMMSRCWGWDGSGMYPPMLSPWAKIELGWLEPRNITSSGQYSLSAAAQYPQAYIVSEGFPDGEYLLIENRQAIGFDALLPQGGIAIWHIDLNANNQNDRGFLGQEGWPQNGNHYRVALLQADGNQDLEKKENNGDGNDLWHHGGDLTVLGPSLGKVVVPSTDSYQDGNVYETGIWIHEFSESGTHMTFEVKGLNGPESPGYYAVQNALTQAPSPISSPTSTPSDSPSISLIPTFSPSAPPTSAPTITPTASPETKNSFDADAFLSGFFSKNKVGMADNTNYDNTTQISYMTQLANATQIDNTTLSPSASPTAKSSDQPSSTDPTLSPVESPTNSPTLEALSTLYFSPDYEEMGCIRKPLAEFASWEKARFISLGDCCQTAMPWEFNFCIMKSVELLNISQSNSVVNMASPPPDDV